MSGVRAVPVADVKEHPRNVRDDLGNLDELANSIQARGILVPLILNQRLDGLWVTDGHRRLAASKMVGLETVPALVMRGQGAADVLTTMLVTAMHKELSPMEQARAFGRLRDAGMPAAEIAKNTGYKESLVRMRLELLVLPNAVQDMVEERTLPLGEARAMAKDIRAKKSTSGTSKKPSVELPTWLGPHHQLASILDCPHRGQRKMVNGSSQPGSRGVACGQCWEKAIREDEREQMLAEGHSIEVDTVMAEAVLAGERIQLDRATRLAVLPQLVRTQRLSDAQLAERLKTTARQILRDRQHLDLEPAIPRVGGPTDEGETND